MLNPDASYARAEIKAWAELFRDRWESVQAALREFDSAVLEAEALWGKSVRERTDRLRRCALTVYVAFESYLDDKRAGGDHFKADPAFAQRTRAQVFASTKDDELSKEIESAVGAIESVLREKMAHFR